MRRLTDDRSFFDWVDCMAPELQDEGRLIQFHEDRRHMEIRAELHYGQKKHVAASLTDEEAVRSENPEWELAARLVSRYRLMKSIKE